MLELKRLKRNRNANSLAYILIFLWFLFGLKWFSDPSWMPDLLFVLVVTIFGLIYLVQRHKAQQQLKKNSTHNQTLEGRNVRMLYTNDVPPHLSDEQLRFYGRWDSGYARQKWWQTLLAAFIISLFALAYYGDLALVWPWYLALAHALVMLGLCYWLTRTVSVIRAHSALFFDEGIWVQGRMIPYEDIKRHQFIPLKQGLRFELNTGQLFLAVVIDHAQQPYLIEKTARPPQAV